MSILKRSLQFITLALLLTFFTSGTPLQELKNHLSKEPNFSTDKSPAKTQTNQSLKAAYVINQETNEILPIHLKTGDTEGGFSLNFPSKILHVSSDGNTVYLANQEQETLVKINLVSGELEKLNTPLELPNKLVVSTNEKKGYALYEKSHEIVYLDIADDLYYPLVTFKLTPDCIAIDPVDQNLYIGFKDSSDIVSLEIKSSIVSPFVSLERPPEAIVIARDGKKMYAVQKETGTFTVIDMVSKKIELIDCGNAPPHSPYSKTEALSVNTRDKALYFVKEKAEAVYALDLLTHTTTTAATLKESVSSLCFLQEQELIASFNITDVFTGHPAFFDARTTHSLKSGKIDYRWDFGDGRQNVSEDPFTEHAYETSGIYEAVLTATQRLDNEIDSFALTHLTASSKEIFEVKESKELDPSKLDRSTNSRSTSLDPSNVTIIGGNSKELADLLNVNLNASPLGGIVPSTTVGTPSSASIVFGQSITDSAVVTGTIIGGSPGGTVTFFVGATQVGSPVTLTPGASHTSSAVSVSYTPSVVGSYQWTASYSGDAFYDISQDASPTNSFIVTQATTTTNLVTSVNPSAFGESVTLTATLSVVAPGAGTPTGTVTFKDGATTIGTGTVSAGVATLSTSSLSVGSHSLTAVFNGDTNFAGSTSNIVTQTVNKASTTIGLTSSVNPVAVGNTTVLTATLSVTAPGAGTPSGTVTFKDGATTIGTGTVTAGVATLSISTLSVGTHSLTAVYGGDANFNTSTSSAVSQVVSQGTTTSLLTSTVNPSTYGQLTTFTGTVSVVTGTGTPTGFFTFLDGVATLGTVNLTGLSASLDISNLSVGSHSVTAVYSGDINFSTSTSPAVSQVVDQATPIINLTSSANPSNYGQLVTFTTTVSSPTTLGLPSGTISYYDGVTLLGTGTLSATGANTSTATFALNTLSGGSHSITAVYSGDTDFVTVTSSAVNQSVVIATTTTTIFSATNNPSLYGQPVVLQAKIVGSVGSPPLTPGRTVTFYDGVTSIGTALVTPLSINTSFATITVSNFSIGSQPLTAQYSGDVNYSGSTSSTLNQIVVNTSTQAVTTTSITPAVFGQTVTLTSTITAVSPGAGSPTGSVQFYDGINLIGTGTLSSSSPNTSLATFSTSSLSLGAHSIKTTYGGDGNYTSSTSPNMIQTIIQDATTTTLSSSLNPSNFGSSITLTANVTSNAPGSGTPTGTVTFYDGATSIGTGTLNGSGVATFSTIALYPSFSVTHSLTAKYNGDTNYTTSTSTPPLVQVVNNQLGTVTTVTSARDASPVSQGVTYSARVTAITGSPTGTVNFYDNGVFFGTGTIAGGVATFTEPGGLLGTLGIHPITAIYSGDANFITSTSAVFNEHIVPYDTTTTLTINPNPAQQDSGVLTATVVASGTPAPIPTFTGTVTFYDGNTAISPAITLPPSGIATYQPIDFRFGSRQIHAVYTGDLTQFATSTSNTVTEQVQQTGMLLTQTVVTSSSSTSYFCQPVTFNATVTQTTGFYIPTGTVTFFNGGVSLGTAVLNASGVASLPVSTLSTGTHSITATYNSDSNYAFSSSAAITQTVQVNPTTTTLSLIPTLTDTPFGQELTFIINVQSTYGTPTGSVILSDENGDIATLELDSTGTATYVSADIETGIHLFTATYDPSCCGVANACFQASSNTLAHTISLVSPHLVLAATPSPAVYGDTILLTATLSSTSNGTPTGTVTFYNGSTLLGTSPIIQGIATFQVSDLPAAVTVFNARYNGNTDFIATNFPSAVISVNKAPVNVSLISLSPNPSNLGETVSLTATVNSLISIPTGTITFYSGATALSTVTLDAGGSAALNVSSLSIGSNTISAVYNGSTNFLTATSPTLTQTVTKSDSITTVTSSTPSPSTFNNSVTFTINVTAASPGTGTPSGTITGYLGSTVLGTSTLSAGSATFSTSVLPVGTNTITVQYSGDTNFNASKGFGTQTTNAATTSVSALTSSNNPAVYGQSVTFSTAVTSTAGIPSGTVSFLDGTTELGVATLSSTGTASLTRNNLTVGTHPITVKYSGSGNFAASTSSTLSQVINKAATTTTLSTTLSSAVFGQAVTFTATVTPTSPGAGIPSGTVTFKNGAVTLGTVALGNGGIVSFSTSSLAASGTPYTITAQYSGDSNFTTSTSSSVSQTVNSVSTITSVISSINPSTLGQTISLNVTVNAVNTGSVIPSGTVTATYGSTVIGTGSINASGQISFLTSTLPAGVIPIIVSYAGNSNFGASSSTIDQTVGQSTTTTTLASSLNPSHLGEVITLTATVSTASGTPTGTVSFFDGTTLIGLQTLISGSATLSTSSLSLGAHSLKAVYSGDTSYSTSTSTTLTQTVNKATTTTSLITSINPTQFGEATLFTATVAPAAGSGTPTGTVTFKDGATTIGTAPVSGGVANLSIANLSVGTHANITASYGGDTNFTASISTALSQVVSTATTTTTLSSSINPSVYGQSVTLTATIQVPVGAGTPGGTVTFKNGTTTIGTATLASGQATLNVSNLNLGSNSLTAIYSGNASFATSTSTALVQVVNQGATTTSLTSNINPSMLGEPIVLTATVSVGSGPTAATGTVTFKDGSIVIGTGTLSAGVATLSISNLNVNSHPLTATYNGDTNYTASTSPQYTQVVTTVDTTTVVSPSINPSIYGTPVTLTATVTADVGAQVPNGLVSFREGTTLIGTVPLTAGVATLTTSSLSFGSHSISAFYVGNADFNSSTSSAFTQTVNAGTTSTTLVSSVNPSTFGQNTTLTASVTVTSGIGTPTGTVTFLAGSTVIGTSTLTGGTATLPISTLSVGPHAITATYSGDDNFDQSSSSTLTQTVNKASSVTNILSTTPNPSMFGQTVTFFSTTTTPVGLPTGTVSFFNGATLLGTVPIYDGLAIFATPVLAIGNHNITATYNGDADFLASTSTPPVVQIVNQTSITATTVTTLTSLLNPSQFGETVEFDVTVTPITGSGVPTGLVTIFSGSNPLTTLTLVNGQASYSTADLPSGTLTIVALYSGDSAYSSSTSTIAQVVQPITTTLDLTSSQNPSVAGQSVTFTAHVTSSAAVSPTGSVSFYNGLNLLGTTFLNNQGFANFTTSSLPTGTDIITASYNADPNFMTSSDTLAQDVNQSPTTTVILTSSPKPSKAGESVTFIASTSSVNGIPTGQLTFYDGATLIGTEPLINGLAIFNSPALTAGSHTITATYGGALDYTTSTSPPYIQTVQEPIFATSIQLSSSQNPAEYGVPVTFNAAVSSSSGIPSGTVSFFDGSNSLGTSLLSNGFASFTTSNLTVGSHPITGIYNGDASFSPATSAPLTEVITTSTVPGAPQDFYGYQVINKYLNYSEYVNVLNWSPPQNNTSVIAYEVYRNANLTSLLGVVNNQGPFTMQDGNRAKNETYTYYIVSVNALGIKSPPVKTEVVPYKKQKNRYF